MRRTLIVTGVVVALAASSSGAWLLYHNQPAPAVTTRPGSIAIDGASSDPTLESAPAIPITPSTPSPIPASSASPRSTSMEQVITDPTEFGVYDQYVKNDTALFQDITQGSGPEAAVGSTLTVNYRGWLTTGKLFDESYTGGQPFSFVLGQHRVIAGWEEGLSGMKVGGKRRLIIPPSAGYGANGQGPIPANAVLVFDVELVGVQAAK